MSRKGPSMYYVITKERGEGGGAQKWQFLIMFSTEGILKGEGRGVRKLQIMIT